jgi:hypothetical protein
MSIIESSRLNPGHGSRNDSANIEGRSQMLTLFQNMALDSISDETRAGDDQVTTPAIRGAVFGIGAVPTRRKMTELDPTELNWTE